MIENVICAVFTALGVLVLIAADIAKAKIGWIFFYEENEKEDDSNE